MTPFPKTLLFALLLLLSLTARGEVVPAPCLS